MHARTRRLRQTIGRALRRCLLGWIVLSLALIVPLRWLAPPFTAFMVRDQMIAWWQGKPDYHWRYQWTDWETVAPHLPLAVVAAEDQRFPYHNGFDWQEIGKAWGTYRDGGSLRGASTISQQVAKNLFLWPGTSFVRKALEAYFTVLIELCWSKRRVLEIYVNIAEFGEGVFGVAAASRVFFDKSPHSLTPEEAALLAAVLPNPRNRWVAAPSLEVIKRRAWILRQMHSLGGVPYVQRLQD